MAKPIVSLGNEQEAPATDNNAQERGPPPRHSQYDRTYPSVEARARITIAPRILALLGTSGTLNWFDIYPGSKLQQDLVAAEQGDDDLRRALRGTDRHGLWVLSGGLLWDSRDHEFAPTRGMFHEISLRGSPGVPFAFGGVNMTGRAYWSLWRPYLVVATRLMADLLFGEVPFYELSRHGGLFPGNAPGGNTAVRGVPVGRYHGRAKVLGNLELRAKVLPFSLFGQRFNLGALAFIDGGRVWADYRTITRFDGSSAGLKVGVGAGLRLQWGETFMIRADAAWSPDADPIGVYIEVNHIF